MKRLVTIIICWLAIALSSICSVTQGMVFDAYTNIKDMNDPNMVLVKISEDKVITVYAPKMNELFIGKAKLNSIHYVCYKELFYEVFITAKGKSNFEYLKEFLFNHYGKGVQRSESIDNWYWLFPDGNHPSLYGTLKYDPTNKVTTLRITYNPMHDLIMQDSEKAASSGEENFLIL